MGLDDDCKRRRKFRSLRIGVGELNVAWVLGQGLRLKGNAYELATWFVASGVYQEIWVVLGSFCRLIERLHCCSSKSGVCCEYRNMIVCSNIP